MIYSTFLSLALASQCSASVAHVPLVLPPPPQVIVRACVEPVPVLRVKVRVRTDYFYGRPLVRRFRPLLPRSFRLFGACQ